MPLPFVGTRRDTFDMAGLNIHDEPESYPRTVHLSAISEARLTRTHMALPVWVRLGFDDGRPEMTARGFA